MSTKVDAAIDAPVAALAELPKHELEFWQRGNRLGVRVLYELNRRYPALAPWRRRRPRFAASRPDFETLLGREPAISRIRRSPSASAAKFSLAGMIELARRPSDLLSAG